MSLCFSILKNKLFEKRSNNVKKSDIDSLNSDVIRSLKSESLGYYLNKKSDIELPVNDFFCEKDAVYRIMEDGVFVIPNFIDEYLVNILCKKIDHEMESYKSKVNSQGFYENESVILQSQVKKVKGYNALSMNPKTIFDFRGGDDAGMVDIFNVDRLFQSDIERKAINEIVKNKFLTDFLKSLPKPLKVQNINSYVNSGVTSTRGFHVDTYDRQIKIFIYLTDVLDFCNGPYTYVRGTHIDTPYRRLNRYLSQSLKTKTETPIIPYQDIYPILAPKGSLVVSDQSGFHRGFPQEVNGFRRILTINCK
ncbi:hypothetical protein J9B83_01430 [Marinomonas sp. A79]|uniref:Phytanoyl-CoA dioxygenase (PhyH) n=1 Tax=Marinomonas vulgaris TaxID=2823372 RepID=A0ABS5H8C8_9GAMM|nr:hypothetical protein [Marinomonas vulgaris]MBR7887584.1 hypothetical protein [Marinomonas vulgaris]